MQAKQVWAATTNSATIVALSGVAADMKRRNAYRLQAIAAWHAPLEPWERSQMTREDAVLLRRAQDRAALGSRYLRWRAPMELRYMELK